MELDSCRKLERKDVCEQGVYNCGKVIMSMRPLWDLLIATHRICFASDTDVYVTQSARCSNAVPKLFFSNDSGKTFTRIAGPMDYNPAAFVDYRGLVAAPIGLVVNCFVCYPLQGGGCLNATFFTATLTNGSWILYKLAEIDWTTHCQMDGIIYSKADNNNLTAFNSVTGLISFSGTLNVTIQSLSCGGPSGLLLGLGDNLYTLSLIDDHVQADILFSFGGRNITAVVDVS
jgi:hypothetical protein